MSSNTLQFQYFWDFSKCHQAIFSQLTFENFWLYLLGARLFWLKIIKNYCKSPLKVCELNVWVKRPPDVFQNLKTVQERKSNLNFIRVTKIHLLINIFYRLIWFNLADDISFSILWMSFCVISSSATLQCLSTYVFRHGIFQFCQC